MFEIGWSELMLIGVVALIVIGPKELPTVLRTVGRTVTKLRRMAGEFQGQFQEALREADVADIRKEISDITESAKSSIGNFPTSEAFDPLRSIREEIRATVEGAGKDKAADAPEAVPAPEKPLDLALPLPEEPPPAPVFDLPAAPEPAPASAAPAPEAAAPPKGETPLKSDT